MIDNKTQPSRATQWLGLFYEHFKEVFADGASVR